MSEHYIQSQFLIKQITDDFFKEKSTNIRIKNQDYEMKDHDVESLISDISDESDLVKMDSPVLNDQYHYLENNNDLHKLFDFCDYNEDVLQIINDMGFDKKWNSPKVMNQTNCAYF